MSKIELLAQTDRITEQEYVQLAMILKEHKEHQDDKEHVKCVLSNYYNMRRQRRTRSESSETDVSFLQRVFEDASRDQQYPHIGVVMIHSQSSGLGGAVGGAVDGAVNGAVGDT